MNADDAQNIRRHTKEARIAGVTGLAFVVLFVAGMLLGSAVPDPSESDEEIVRFYRDGGERLLIILGAYILPFAGIAFLWFMAATRTLLLEPRHRPSAVLVPMQFAAGVLFVAAAFVGAAANVAAASGIDFLDSRGDLDPDTLRTYPQLASAVFLIFGIRMAGVLVATTTVLGRVMMPLWLRVVGYVVAAVLLLAVSFIELFVLIFPGWVLIFSAWLLLVPGRGANLGGA